MAQKLEKYMVYLLSVAHISYEYAPPQGRKSRRRDAPKATRREKNYSVPLQWREGIDRDGNGTVKESTMPFTGAKDFTATKDKERKELENVLKCWLRVF